MTKWLAMLMACLALGLVVAACGDDDDDDGGGGADTTEEPAPAGGGAEDEAAPAGETVEVTMKDIAFDPTSVEVAKGATVKWTNDESSATTSRRPAAPAPSSARASPGGMNQGDTFEETFNTAGKIDYVCTVHPNMTGSITVK